MNSSPLDRQGNPFPDILRSRLAKSSPPGEQHPDADRLNAFAQKRLATHDRDQVASHLAICSECRDVLLLAASATTPLADAQTTPEHRLRVRWAAAGLAIAACLAMIIVWQSGVFSARSPEQPARIIKEAATAKIPNPVLAHPSPSRNAGISQLTFSVPSSSSRARSEAVPVAQFFRQPAFQWRIGHGAADRDDGKLQRSDDHGKTWMIFPLSRTARFYDVSSNGSNVWVGGMAGELLHSDDDGFHWTRIIVNDNGAPMQETIVRLETHSPKSIELATASGARWMSSDGGLHWRRY